MSNEVNTILLERAREASENGTGSSWAEQLDAELSRPNPDLDFVRELTIAIENHLDVMENLQDETR